MPVGDQELCCMLSTSVSLAKVLRTLLRLGTARTSLLNLRMQPEANSTISLDDSDALRTNDLEGLHNNRNDLQEEKIFRQLLTSSITIGL